MLIIVVLCIIFILFIVCVMTITLSDTETFKAIDRRIANKIERKGKKKWKNICSMMRLAVKSFSLKLIWKKRRICVLIHILKNRNLFVRYPIGKPKWWDLTHINYVSNQPGAIVNKLTTNFFRFRCWQIFKLLL